MSWMQKLYETYEACVKQDLVGKRDTADNEPMLLPLYHGTQQAQLEVAIDGQGNWLPNSVVVIPKEEQETLIMGTPESLGGQNNINPKAIFDKLIYLAGDYSKFYTPEEGKKSQKNTNPEAYYQSYVEALTDWCESEYRHPDAIAWLTYVRKGCLIKDLLDAGIFQLNDSGKIDEKWKGTGKALDAFVRIRVRQPDGEDKLWMISSLSYAYIDYQNSQPKKADLCYVLGRQMPLSTTNPKYIRYAGDNAKLVSANDSDGFTYRGRFETAEEALTIGWETSEKAHAALKYLIRMQGYRNGEQVILTFGTGGEKLPSVDEDTAMLADNAFLPEEYRLGPAFSLKESLARDVKLALTGYKSKMDPKAEAIVIGLDSATPGRLSIFYYRELSAEDFFNRILRWHTSCVWLHQYRYRQQGVDDKGKPVYRRVVFIGAPAPIDIVKAAYGEKVSDKLKKSGVERLLPCIVDGARLPRDIVSAVARRAAQRAALDLQESDKALSIACALIRKSINDAKHKEVWDMALQPEVTDRSYLFGRAWAYAEAIERFALKQAGENRNTNAERLMTAFPKHPKASWGILMDRLRPYQNKLQSKLGPMANALNNGMDEVICRLEMEGFTNDPLDETYLLGYAC
ncbi:MAG: type I-C CRISPR-associated protein Cas8c/Csd1, partial [Eubacteriales bacterium]|nr:type I-C CRISPR-associated protein Cas8c/Csd1 [Eubacteriales bacterium]